jgi:hypothetical protein
VTTLAELGQYDRLVLYAKREGFTPNWMQLRNSYKL